MKNIISHINIKHEEKGKGSVILKATDQNGKVWSVYDIPSTNPNKYRHIYKKVLNRVNKQNLNSLIIVDVGCSTGEPVEKFSSYLERKGIDTYVVGVDYREKSLEAAIKNSRIDEGHRALAQKLPFNNNYADVVICLNLINPSLPEKEQELTYKELFRVCKYRNLVITEYILDSKLGNHLFKQTAEEAGANGWRYL